MRQEQIDWELAGIVTERGLLDRPLRDDLLKVPDEVELDGEHLIWKTRTAYKTPVDVLGKLRVQPRRTLLWDFVHLANGPPQRILKYARKCGVLNLCEEHSLPASHGPLPYDTGSGRCRPRVRRENDWEVGREPLSAWRDFAREARALLRVAAQLHQGKRGEREDWQQALASWDPYWRKIKEPFETQFKLPSPPHDVEDGQMHLANHVNWWLRLADVRPMFTWSILDPAFFKIGGTGIKLAYGGRLFGALAVQLMLAISRSDGLAICSNCAQPYFPKRRPRSGERNYCTGLNCGRRAALRDAQRRCSSKKKKVGRKSARRRGQARALSP